MLSPGRNLWSITLPPFALVQHFGRSHADENELRLKVDALFGHAEVSFSTPLTSPRQREDFPMHPNCPLLRTMNSVWLLECILPLTPKCDGVIQLPLDSCRLVYLSKETQTTNIKRRRQQRQPILHAEDTMSAQRQSMLHAEIHYESTTQAHTSTLETKQVGVYTVPDPRNCAATSDQSVITLKYLPRRKHACQHHHMSSNLSLNTGLAWDGDQQHG